MMTILILTIPLEELAASPIVSVKDSSNKIIAAGNYE
jgi:hypothetical protein